MRSVAFIDLQSSDSSSIIDSGILEPSELSAIFSDEREELHINLYMMSGNLLFIPFKRLYAAFAHRSRQQMHVVASQNIINAAA